MFGHSSIFILFNLRSSGLSAWDTVKAVRLSPLSTIEQPTNSTSPPLMPWNKELIALLHTSPPARSFPKAAALLSLLGRPNLHEAAHPPLSSLLSFFPFWWQDFHVWLDLCWLSSQLLWLIWCLRSLQMDGAPVKVVPTRPPLPPICSWTPLGLTNVLGKRASIWRRSGASASPANLEVDAAGRWFLVPRFADYLPGFISWFSPDLFPSLLTIRGIKVGHERTSSPLNPSVPNLSRPSLGA